jgi:hypothetical protein
MLLKTSTITAPWTIIEGNCKWYARVKCLSTLVDGLSQQLSYVPPGPELGHTKSPRGGDKKPGKKS